MPSGGNWLVNLVFQARNLASSQITQLTTQLQQMRNTASTLSTVGEQFKSMGDGIASFGKELLVIPGALAAVGGMAVKKFADVDASAAQLKTNLMNSSGAVDKDFEKMKALAEKLGVALPGSTKDMLDMFNALREQGVQTSNILGGMGQAAAEFSVLFNRPFADGAEKMAKFSEALGVSDEKSKQLVDILQRVKGAAGVSVDDLFYTFKYAGATLKTMGIQGLQGARDFSAAIGMMAMSSIDGSTAGTGIASGLTQLATMKDKLATKKGQKLIAPVLSKYNIDLQFFNSSGQFVGIRNLVRELEKLKKLTQEERLNVLKKLFGDQAMRPLSVFIEQGVDGFDKMNKRMQDQADIKKKISVIMDTLKMKWDTLTGTVDTFTAKIGEIISKNLNLTKVLDRINDKVADFTAWMDKNPKKASELIQNITKAAAVLVAVGGTLVVIGTALSTVGTIATSISSGLTFFTTISTQIPALLTGLSTAIGYIQGIGSAIAGFSAWPLLAIVAVAVPIWKYWQQIKDFFKGFWEGLKSGIAESGLEFEQLKTVWGGVLEPFKAVLPVVKEFFKWLLTPVKNDSIGSFKNGFLIASAVIKTLIKGFTFYYSVLGDSIKTIINLIAWLGRLAGTIANAIAPAVKGIANLVIWYYSKIFQGWATIFNFIFKGGLTNAVKSVGSFLAFVWNNITTFLGNAKSAVFGFFTSIPEKLAGLGEALFNAGVKLFEMLKKGMESVPAFKPVLDLAQKIMAHLPQSPAKEGPLRNIKRVKIMETIAETLTPSSVITALQKSLMPIQNPVSFLPKIKNPIADISAARNRATAVASKITNNTATPNITVNYAPVIGSGNSQDVLLELRRHPRELAKLIQDNFDRSVRLRFADAM